MEEIWKNVPEYEGLYQVSNLGRVRSLAREWIAGNGGINKHNGKILKLTKSSSGYLTVCFWKNSMKKNVLVHQLVAVVFLGHNICGHEIVIDHINDDKYDNRVENLQLVTQRFNTCKTQGNYSSKFKGVHFKKNNNKWQSRITINYKLIHLGYFENEYDAHLAYQNALKNLEQ